MGYLFVIWAVFPQSYLECLLFLLLFSKFCLSDFSYLSGYNYTQKKMTEWGKTTAVTIRESNSFPKKRKLQAQVCKNSSFEQKTFKKSDSIRLKAKGLTKTRQAAINKLCWCRTRLNSRPRTETRQKWHFTVIKDIIHNETMMITYMELQILWLGRIMVPPKMSVYNSWSL